MTVYVALLRALGPATHPKMSMAALREAATAAGFGNAETVGNTGNLIVSSEAGEDDVRLRLQAVVDGFGIRSEVFVRAAPELLELVGRNPFHEATIDHPAGVGVCFFHRTPAWPGSADYNGPEAVAVIGRQLVVEYRGRVTGSRLEPERRLGQSMTQRNWRVVAGLAAKAAKFPAMP